MISKKGVSDVVTIVLTVMITIAAIGIIWAAVIPMIRTNIIDSSACNDVDVSIDIDSGYTCNDQNLDKAIISVKKGPANVNVTSLNFLISSEGNSVSYSADVQLEQNSNRVFRIDTTGLGNISKISVVPIVSTGKKEQQCKEVYIESIKNCALTIDEIKDYPEAINEKNYWNSLAVSDLPDFKVGEKYDVYLKDDLCEPTEDNCEWSIYGVEEYNPHANLFVPKIDFANYNRPMLPMGISFEEESNLAHFYHKVDAIAIPETKYDPDTRPSQFKITVKIQRPGQPDKTKTFEVNLVP